MPDGHVCLYNRSPQLRVNSWIAYTVTAKLFLRWVIPKEYEHLIKRYTAKAFWRNNVENTDLKIHQ